jgi:O-antigen/teichoic acid export membrane protein
MSHSKQVFKNSLYLLNSQIIISVIGTIFLFITARLLKTQELAIVATFYILSGIISTLSQLGIPAIALREIPPLFAQNKITEVQRN